MDSPNRISLTPTVAKQTQKQEFGEVLKNTIQTAASLGGSLLGGMLPGGGVVSAAVSNVSALANNPGARSASYAASGVSSLGSVPVGGASLAGAGIAGGSTGQAMSTSNQNIGGMGDMISQMRAEADRSMAMQMQMQSESRDYNTLSNVLKVRHDSAKSAINNIR